MNDLSMESPSDIDRRKSDVSNELDRSGIVLERRSSSQNNSGASGVLGHWSEHHVKYTSVATFLGILFAFWQLNVSVQQFEQQMSEQRESTSSQLVSDFFKQVGDMTAWSSTRTNDSPNSHKEIERFVVSRAQMLIDSEQTKDFRNEIVRFLGSNGYGSFFGPKPKIDEPGINLNSANLTDIRIYGADFNRASFFCVGFIKANISRTNFTNSDINNTDFSGSQLDTVNFSLARIRGVNFNNVTLFGQPSFKDASIVKSDFTGLTLPEPFVHGLAKISGDTSPEGLVRAQNEYLAVLLSETKSLSGTKLDPGLHAALEQLLDPNKFAEVFGDTTASNLNSVSITPNLKVVDYRANCRQPPADSA